MKKLILTIFFLLPFAALAALPAFPMSFYGTVTINGTPAPVGTIIRAYYGATLTGEIVVNEVGIYGYDNPTQQQLLLGEGTGTIRFTVQSSTINSDTETGGATEESHPAFVSGGLVSKNFAFTWSAPISTPAPTPTPAPSGGGSGGGGGGGGGSASSVLYGCMDKNATNYSPIANTDNKACIYPVVATTSVNTIMPLISTTRAVTSTVQQAGEVLGATTFVFTSNLFVGSSGADVTELQKRLTNDGFYAGPVTGYFGPLTASGVKKFQSAHGLEQVGNVGPKTRAALNQSGPAVLGASTAISVPVMTPEARAALIKQLLAMILELQKQLAELKAGR